MILSIESLLCLIPDSNSLILGSRSPVLGSRVSDLLPVRRRKIDLFLFELSLLFRQIENYLDIELIIYVTMKTLTCCRCSPLRTRIDLFLTSSICVTVSSCSISERTKVTTTLSVTWAITYVLKNSIRNNYKAYKVFYLLV